MRVKTSSLQMTSHKRVSATISFTTKSGKRLRKSKSLTPSLPVSKTLLTRWLLWKIKSNSVTSLPICRLNLPIQLMASRAYMVWFIRMSQWTSLSSKLMMTTNLRNLFTKSRIMSLRRTMSRILLRSREAVCKVIIHRDLAMELSRPRQHRLKLMYPSLETTILRKMLLYWPTSWRED